MSAAALASGVLERVQGRAASLERIGASEDAADLRAILAALSPEAPSRDRAPDAKTFKRAFWKLAFDAVPAHDNPGDCKWRLSSTAVRILADAAVEALTPRHEAPAEGAGEIAKVLEFYAAEWDYHPGDGEAPDATHPGSAPTFYEAEPTDALKDDGGMMARTALAALRARSSAPEAHEGEAVAWRPIDCAPKDGTAIDVWRDEGGRETVYWGYPPHECGEMGGLCDSDWHSIRAAGWVCSTFGEFLGRNHNPFTHWQPLPTGPSSIPDALKGDAK